MTEHLNRMAVFNAVATAGSFRGAAKTLGISPSVVSHHIARLESQFDLPLIYRSTRRLSLTDAGLELFENTQRMLRAADAGVAAMHRRRNNITGKLRITMPDAMQHPSFNDGLIAFAQLYPGLTLDVTFSDDLVDLGGSSFDLALRGTAIDLNDSAYKMRRICALQICMVAAPSYVQDRELPSDVTDLVGWDRVMHPPGIRLKDIVLSSVEFQEMSASIIVNGIMSAIDCAKAGLGVLLVPELPVRSAIASGILVRLCPKVQLRKINLYGIWPNTLPKDSAVYLLVDFLEDFHRQAEANAHR